MIRYVVEAKRQFEYFQGQVCGLRARERDVPPQGHARTLLRFDPSVLGPNAPPHPEFEGRP